MKARLEEAILQLSYVPRQHDDSIDRMILLWFATFRKTMQYITMFGIVYGHHVVERPGAGLIDTSVVRNMNLLQLEISVHETNRSTANLAWPTLATALPDPWSDPYPTDLISL